MKITGTAEEIRCFKEFAVRGRLNVAFSAAGLRENDELVVFYLHFLDKKVELSVEGGGKEKEMDEKMALLERLKHLLQSKTIAKYDAVDVQTGKYLEDICTLDAIVAGEKSKQPILFLCDHRACDNCGIKSNSRCELTKDIHHAKNFKNQQGKFIEQELSAGIYGILETTLEGGGKERGPDPHEVAYEG